jgi:cobalamin biosynthesis protein CobT
LSTVFKKEYTRKEWFGIMTLEEALVEIQRLQEIIQQKDRQIEELKKRKNAGRPPQNKKWMRDYQVFTELYEQGIPIAEIAEQVEYSKRTCYRYKSYYDEMKSQEDEKC